MRSDPRSMLLFVVPPLLLLASVPARGEDELPVTVKSPEARTAFARGRAHYFNLRTEEARTAFAEAVRVEPDFAIAHAWQALATRPASDGKPAIDLALKLRNRVTPSERLFIDAAIARLRGDIDGEITRFEQLAEAHPKDWRLLVLLGNRLFRAGRYEDAIAPLEKATRVGVDEAAPWNDLGYAYAYSGRLDDALRALRTYADRLPTEPNPQDSLGEIQLLANRPRDATAAYERALKIDPAFAIANEGLGHSRLISGDFDGAREAYRRLARDGRTTDERLAGLGWVAATYAHEGRLDETVRQLEQAQQGAVSAGAKAWVVEFQSRRSIVLTELGRTKEAVAVAQQALKAAKAGNGTVTSLRAAARAHLAHGFALARSANVKAVRPVLDALRKLSTGDAEVKHATWALGAAVAAAVAKQGGGAPAAAWAATGLPPPDRWLKRSALSAFGPDPWAYVLASDASEAAGDAKEAADLRTWAQELHVVTPELGLVRPRLLAGTRLEAGALYGPMPVTTRSAAALALFVEGRRLGEAYRRDVALAALEKAMSLDPQFVLARATAAMFAESPELAARYLADARKLVDKGEGSAAERLLVDALEADGKGDAARKEAKLRELVRLHPNDFRPRTWLGEHLLRMGRMKEAVDVLDDAVARASDQPLPYNGLGYALAFEGRFDDAVRALERYVSLLPGESNPHDSLGEVLLLAGRPSEAERAYRRSLELSPQFTASWAGLGHARLFAGDSEGAREAYREMAARAGEGPDRTNAMLWMAMTKAWAGKFEDAASQLADAAALLRTEGDVFSSHLLEARRVPLLAEAGQHKAAIDLANQVLKSLTDKRGAGRLSPASQAVVRRHALWGRGWAELLASQPDKVALTLDQLEATVGKDPHGEAATQLATLQAALDLHDDEPRAALKALARADRRHPIARVLLAEASEQSDNPDAARPLRDSVRNPTANHADLAIARRREAQLAR